MAEKDGGLWFTLKLLGDLGFIIAIPLVVLGLLGRFLDKKFNSSPWLLLAGLFISLVISSIYIYKKTLELTKQMEEASKDKPKETQ